MGKLFLCCDELYTAVGRELLQEAFDVQNIAEKTILIVTLAKYSISLTLQAVCLKLGFFLDNIIIVDNSDIRLNEDRIFDFIYISGGNTFEILQHIQNNNLISIIQQSVERNGIYIGVSAGAIIAGVDIILAKDFDKNALKLEDLYGLNLLRDSTIIPHYSKQDLTRYKKNLERKQLENYKKIYNVADGNIRVFEV